MKPIKVSAKKVLAGRVLDLGLSDIERQLVAARNGLKARIAGINTRADPGCYTGEMVFHPEAQSFPLDVLQDGTTVLVNYIVKSGYTYNIPIRCCGDGVFKATSVRCVVFQRFYNATPGIMFVCQLPVVPNTWNPAGPMAWTQKWSCYPYSRASPGAWFGQTPSINYHWNLQDPISGSLYSDNMLPAEAMLPRHYVPAVARDQQGTKLGPVHLIDGDWHEFETPWEFETGQSVNFMFRPITDIVQVDSSIDQGPAGQNVLLYDDRENGRRDMSVTVQVELQGERVGGRQ
jgi:hypothetical protein